MKPTSRSFVLARVPGSQRVQRLNPQPKKVHADAHRCEALTLNGRARCERAATWRRRHRRVCTQHTKPRSIKFITRHCPEHGNELLEARNGDLFCTACSAEDG